MAFFVRTPANRFSTVNTTQYWFASVAYHIIAAESEEPNYMQEHVGSVYDPRNIEEASPAAEGTLGLKHATQAQRVPRKLDLNHASLYFNRELSWLDFNWRVLFQAKDERVPLLERVRFLAIVSSNLDEFFRKRVGGLKRQVAAGVRKLSPDGRTPEDQLLLTAQAVPSLYHAIGEVWKNELKPAIETQAGVVIKDYSSLTKEEREAVNSYFQEKIFPILTPLAVDPGHPFPFISNLSLSLAVMLRHPVKKTEHFARIKVPVTRERWIPVNEHHHFIPIEQVIANNIGALFKGMEILGVYPFRITRNADIRRNEEEAEDLIEMISEELRERRYASVVRLEIQSATPEHVRLLLMRELGLQKEDVYETANGLIDHTACMALANLNIPEHQYEPWEPMIPRRLRPEGDPPEAPNVFKVIRDGDLLVHHPYESFKATTQHFVEAAADDPKVLAIKQTLYRTSDESPIVKALMRAAEREKQVAVLVEVKARFDEEANLYWASQMEEAGVKVLYSMPGLKVHAKIAMVVRREGEKLVRYCYLGTGNFNEKTASIYVDEAILTVDTRLTSEINKVFQFLNGKKKKPNFEHLLVAPFNMRKQFNALIEQEIEEAKAGRKAEMTLKMNSLEDEKIIARLYKASQAGVKIRIVVRGICRLVPGIPGQSENIEVTSIVDRFLEHARIYLFHNAGKPVMYLASADWMKRNLSRRIEVAFPIYNRTLFHEMKRMLGMQLRDNVKARIIDAQHSNTYVKSRRKRTRAQYATYELLGGKV